MENIKTVELKVLPKDLENEDLIKKKAANKAGIPFHKIGYLKIIKRSIDARSKQPFFLLRVELAAEEPKADQTVYLQKLKLCKIEKQDILIILLSA